MRYVMLNGTIAINTRLEMILKQRSRPVFRYHSIIFLVEVREAAKQHNESSRFIPEFKCGANQSRQESGCRY
jgi:hypothetical protein